MASTKKRTPPDNSVCISASKLAEMYEKSWDWARDLLKEWYADQEKGGPVRVFRRGKKEIYTTIAILQQWMPPARDQALIRKYKELDKDLDDLNRRMNYIITDVREIQKHLRLPLR